MICNSISTKHSTSHTLIYLTEKNTRAIKQRKLWVWNICWLSKSLWYSWASYTYSKSEHYGVRGTANNWFSSYLENRTHFVRINGYSSDLILICCGVLQGSILGPLLFLLYINDLHYAIKHCKVHHFADDTNLLNFSHSIKRLIMTWKTG